MPQSTLDSLWSGAAQSSTRRTESGEEAPTVAEAVPAAAAAAARPPPEVIDLVDSSDESDCENDSALETERLPVCVSVKGPSHPLVPQPPHRPPQRRKDSNATSRSNANRKPNNNLNALIDALPPIPNPLQPQHQSNATRNPPQSLTPSSSPPRMDQCESKLATTPFAAAVVASTSTFAAAVVASTTTSTGTYSSGRAGTMDQRLTEANAIAVARVPNPLLMQNGSASTTANATIPQSQTQLLPFSTSTSTALPIKRVRQSCLNEKKTERSLKRPHMEERLATNTTRTLVGHSYANARKPADNVQSHRLGANSTKATSTTTSSSSTRRVSSSPDSLQESTASWKEQEAGATIPNRKEQRLTMSPCKKAKRKSLGPSSDGTTVQAYSKRRPSPSSSIANTTGCNNDYNATLRVNGSSAPTNDVLPTIKDVDRSKGSVNTCDGSRDRDLKLFDQQSESSPVPEHPSCAPEYMGVDAEPPLPLMKDVATKCWRCFEELTSSSNEEPCLYATHLHVVLDVRVCSVCAEAVAAIENSKNVEEKSSFCAGCAIGDDDCNTTFFLCDTDTCERVFCRHCVAQSWGGGKMGWQKSLLLEATDDLWYCPGCCPPSPLIEQKDMVTNELKCQAKQEDRSVDFLLNLLARADTAKKECEDEREGDSEENASNAEALQCHDDRLSDFIVGLLDELDTNHKLSAAVCYMYLGILTPTLGECLEKPNNESDNESVGNDEPDDGSVEEPDWVRRANKRVDKDRKNDERKSIVLVLPKEAYEKDDYEGVEDLGSDDIVTRDVTVSIRPGFGRGIRPSEEMIRVACASVEELTAPISAMVDDEEDQKAMLSESQWAIGGGARQEFKRPRLPGCPPTPDPPRSVLAIPIRTSDPTGQEKRSESNKSVPLAVVLATTTNESMLSLDAKENVSCCDDSIGSDEGSTKSVGRLTSGEVTSKATPPKTRKNSMANTVDEPNELSECVVPVASPAHLNQPNKPLKLCVKGEHLHDVPNVRTVVVRASLSKVLKPHQREGVQFMWNNCFSDFAFSTNGDDTQYRGCILAHSMGLGKSLSTIALLHTVMTNRTMVSSSNDGADVPLIRKILLVVPVNTVANWEHEFSKWQEDLLVTNLNDVLSERRAVSIQKWSTSSLPGILLTTEGILKTCENLEAYLKPDVLVMDEVHTMIRNPKNAAFKMLKALSPRRIIGLTGSPFQNNLAEYFHMMNFLRPNVLGHSNESTFLREYAKPIADGMASNASPKQARVSLEKAKELHKQFDPFVHRVDSKVLQQDLPPISQVVLHVRQSRMQAKLYRAHKRSLDTVNSGDVKSNFLKQYNVLRPIHSHPGSLLFPTDSKRQKGEERDEIGDWWTSTVNMEGNDKAKGVMHGYKITLLLHLLASAQHVGDKVVIFANSLATLNYIEYVLTTNWIEQVPSLESSFPDLSSTLWEKSRDFFRIDGAVSAADRGDVIKQFEESKTAKVMLLSKAGGIGINLTSANRIVIIDQHFNPTISSQAISRVFRYGQTKPVFCYTMLTQGTTEEKVYGRCVNKTGIALRIIDSKTIDRCFTNEELQDLSNNLTWVQCDDCDKWRVLLGKVPDENIPDTWTCSMNLTDELNNHCHASEKDQTWYENYEQKRQQSLPTSPTKANPEVENEQSESSMRCGDTILQHVLSVTEEGKSKTLVCDHHFQEALMATASLELALQEMADSGEEPACTPDPFEISKVPVVSVELIRSPQKKPRAAKTTLASETVTGFHKANTVGDDEKAANSKTDNQKTKNESCVDTVQLRKSHLPVIKKEQIHVTNFGAKSNYSSHGPNAGATFDSEEEDPTDV